MKCNAAFREQNLVRYFYDKSELSTCPDLWDIYEVEAYTAYLFRASRPIGPTYFASTVLAKKNGHLYFDFTKTLPTPSI